MFWPSIYMLAGSLASMYWNDLQHLRDNTCRNLCDLKTSSKCVGGFLSKFPLMVVYIFWNAKSVFLHFCHIQCLYFCHTDLKKNLKRHHLSWTSVMFELKIDIIILIFFWPSPKSSSVIALCLVLWLKSFNNICFIHDDNWNTAVEPLSHLHYSFKVSVHNECDDAAQKAVYVLTLGPLNLVASFGFNLFLFLFFCIFSNLHNNMTCLSSYLLNKHGNNTNRRGG